MRVFVEFAVGVNLDNIDKEEFARWDDWSRELVQVIWACQTAEGFFFQDALGRRIEVLGEDQERLGTPMMRDFMTELIKTGATDLRDYAVRLCEDEES